MTFNDRTGLEELDEDQCWELLGSKSIGRLAVSITNHPDIFPVNYRLADRQVVVRSAPGIKLAAATLGTAVAFEVDSLDETAHTGWSVVLQGSAKEVQRPDELAAAEALGVEPWADSSKHRFFRITADRITGRRIPTD